MLSVPPGDAQARSVLALTVVVASRIAEFRVAEFAIPAIVALALVVHAAAVRATAQVAELHRAVVAAELQVANAFLSVRVEFPVVGAVGQTWNGGLVLNRAVLTGPSLLADARAVSAEAMVGAGRVWAVGLLAESSLEPTRTRALAAHAMTVAVTIGHLAFVVRELALLALPARVAVTLAVGVVATLIAQHRTNAC